ncbi:MAG: PAS domain-containing sensor histidine kinase [Candidatus Levybacteria bacterium]|nr:PAS domain-containing sensor histidine kinase [Candidatus Levybacteria bacterium]
MEIVLLITVAFGLICIWLSWKNDLLEKEFKKEKNAHEDNIYKVSVLKEFQKKIAYTLDIEKVTTALMESLEHFFPYSAASSMIIKDDKIIFNAYVEDQIGNDYLKNVEEKMISSLSQLAGNLPKKIDKYMHEIPLNSSIKSTYLSSFHAPLIVSNKVVALIHLSSIKENLYKESEMSDLYDLLDIATSSLTQFKEAVDTQGDMFASLMKSVNDGIFMVDNKNQLLLINDSAKKLLKITRENINFFDIINILPPDLALTSIINGVIVNNDSISKKAIRINDKVIDIQISPAQSDKVSIVMRDMTDYRQKEASKEDQTNIMIHELRAPITNIKDSAQLLISTDDWGKEKTAKFLQIIHTQAKKILGQIGSILDTAKLDAGKLTLQKTKGDIVKLIKEEMESFTPQAERKNISLSLNITEKNFPLIYFDNMRIGQTIDNLLSNSLKFTPENGKITIEIDYKTLPPKLDGSSPMEEFFSLEKYIVVSVSDTGIGITKEQQSHLFSKYTQAQNEPQELVKLGTGLGLYLVKGIIESHEGRVWVNSAPEQGATISFSLPATDDAKTSFDAPKPNPSPLPKLSQTIN